MSAAVFGKNLRSLRQSRGLTQAQLAESLGISASTIGMYEQGRREPDNATLAKICALLRVSTDCVLGFTPAEEQQAEREVHEVIDEFTQLLEKQQGLMFNGQPISEDDREKIAAAIRVAAAVAVSQQQHKK